MIKKKITSAGLRGIINSFTLWKYVKAITTPFENTMAYRLGIIDAKGNYLKNPNKLTRQENNALTNFDVMIFNLKKLFDKIIDPSIKVKLRYIPSAIPLLAEEAEKYGADGEFIIEQLLALTYDKGFVIEEVEEIENTFLIEQVASTNTPEHQEHIPHPGELIYTGDYKLLQTHLNSTVDALSGNQSPDHNLSIKADGRMSVNFGKSNGVHFAEYAKGKKSYRFYSKKELVDWAEQNNKPHYIEPITAALAAASHPRVGPNESFLADIIIGGKGNLIRYNNPTSAESQIAVRRRHDSETGNSLANPDMSYLNTDTQHFPHIGLTNLPQLDPQSIGTLKGHIANASKIFSDEKVQRLIGNISKHRDLTKKSATRSDYLVKFSNGVQKGKYQRTLEGFKQFTDDEISNANGPDTRRHQAHYDILSRDTETLEQLFNAHNSIDQARDIIYDHITKHATKLTPAEGHKHEGIVSEKDGNMIKFVPRSFSKANFEQKGKFDKKLKSTGAVLYSGKFGTITDAHSEMTRQGIELARKLGASHFVHGPTTSSGHILSHREKSRILQSAAKPHLGDIKYSVTSPESVNPFHHIDELIGQGHTKIHFIGGSDRITTKGPNNLADSLTRYMTKHGGKWKTQSGELVDLDLQFHQVGETRGSDTELSNMSGTALRNALQRGDTEAAHSMMPRGMSPAQKNRYANRLVQGSLKESILSNIMSFLREEGEAVQASPVINSVGAGGIAGIGQDASDGNVVVRRRPPILRRKRRK